MSKIIIFPCSKGKKEKYWENKGQKVEFVANPNPDNCAKSQGFLHCHPDDINTDTGKTWRQELQDYNEYCQRTNKNPFGLYKACELYEPKRNKQIYNQLYQNFKSRLFILSAGWGLVRADYLLPHYDITLKENVAICNRRTKQRKFDDFNHLAQNIQQDDIVLFPILNDYIDLFHELTKRLTQKKFVFAQDKPPEIDAWQTEAYIFKKYDRKHTSWQYKWAEDAINGVLLP